MPDIDVDHRTLVDLVDLVVGATSERDLRSWFLRAVPSEHVDDVLTGESLTEKVTNMLFRWAKPNGCLGELFLAMLKMPLSNNPPLLRRLREILPDKPWAPDPLALASLCCRSFETAVSLGKLARRSGVTLAANIIHGGPFERWITLTQYCRRTNRQDLIENAILDSAPPYSHVWRGFSQRLRPAGDWSDRTRLHERLTTVNPPRNPYIPLDYPSDAHSREILDVLGLLAVDRIQQSRTGDFPCALFASIKPDLIRYSEDPLGRQCLDRASELGWLERSSGGLTEFAEAEFAFGVAAACLAERLIDRLERVGSDPDEPWRCLLEESTPARHALTLALFQQDERIPERACDWRQRLLADEPTAIDGSANEERLDLLVRLTRLLLDVAALNPWKAIDEIVEWSWGAGLHRHVPDLMLQLGIREPGPFLDLLATPRLDKDTTANTLRSLRVLYDQDQNIELPRQERYAMAIRSASLHATADAIRENIHSSDAWACLRWLDLLPDLLTDPQLEVLLEVALLTNERHCTQRNRERALNRLVWNPQPERIWSCLDQSGQLRWLRTLAERGLESVGIKEHLTALLPRLGAEAMTLVEKLARSERSTL